MWIKTKTILFVSDKYIPYIMWIKVYEYNLLANFILALYEYNCSRKLLSVSS